MDKKKEDVIFKNKWSFKKKTCFMFHVRCLFASRVEIYNINLFFMCRINDFEVYKGY
jgi:hypothetical protein